MEIYRIKIKNLVKLIPFLYLCTFFLIDLLGVSSNIKYTMDFIMFMLIVYVISKKRNILSNCYKPTVYIFLVFIFWCTLTSIINGVDFKYYIWAVRCTFRFFAFYYLSSYYLSIEDIKHMFSKFEVLFYINFACVLFEFFVIGTRQDNIGGIFGIQSGCNGFMHIFLIVMLTYTINEYMFKKIKLQKLLIYILISLMCVSFAELKVFYFELLFILSISVLFNSFSFRKLALVLSGFFGMIVGLFFLNKYFPESFSMLFDSNEIYNYLTAKWAGGKEVTRLTGIEFVNENFFKSNLFYKIFGLGFGNCENSAFFNTPFSLLYSRTNYRLFTFVMQYLETGFIGLIALVSFYISIFYGATKLTKRSNNEKNRWLSFVRLLVPAILIIVWYGDQTRSEGAYLLFLCLSIFEIIKKTTDEYNHVEFED